MASTHIKQCIDDNDLNFLNQLSNVNIVLPDMDTPLVYATSQRKHDIVKALLAKGAMINLPRLIDQATALHVAVANKDDAMIAILLYASPNLDLVSNTDTPVSLALKLDIFEAISGELYLSFCVENNLPQSIYCASNFIIHSHDNWHMFTTHHTSALCQAVKNKNEAVVTALLNLGAQPFEAAGDGTTAFEIAVGMQDAKLVQLLLEHKKFAIECHRASMYVVEFNNREDKQSYLMQAFKLGNKQICDLLRDGFEMSYSNFFTTLKTEDQQEFLLQLQKMSPTDFQNFFFPEVIVIAAATNDFATVKSCIETLHVDVDTTDPDGRTALMKACSEGNVEIVKYLLENNADVNLLAGNERTAVHEAVENRHFDILCMLKEADADLDVTDSEGETPLYLAVKSDNLDIVKYLVDNGADLNNKVHNSTYLYVACEEGCSDVVSYLLSKGADVHSISEDEFTSLYIAARYGHLECCKMLVDKGAVVNQATDDGFFPLYVAAEHNHMEVVQYLVSVGGDPGLKTSEKFVPLYIAAENGLLDMCKYLISLGVEIDVKNSDGCTPLYMACQNGHIEVVELLRKHGADINCESNYGYIALHVACEYGQFEVVKYLVEHGAILDKKGDENRFSPIHFAKLKNNQEIVDYLLAKGAKDE